jgi:hypothetical protein
MSPNAGGGGGVVGSQPMSKAVHRSPNKLWRSNSIFNHIYVVDIYLPFAYFDGRNYENLINNLLQLSPVDLRRDTREKEKEKMCRKPVYLRRV